MSFRTAIRRFKPAFLLPAINPHTSSRAMSNWKITSTVEANPALASTMRAMGKIAPLALAETSWDNVGLLIEAPAQISQQTGQQGVLLAIDLTTAVCDEILSRPERIKVAVVYHPIIFRGLKSMTFADTQQTSLLRLISHGVSIYCPHTSLDATLGGINDWLGLVVSCENGIPDLSKPEEMSKLIQTQFASILPSKEAEKVGMPGAGMGRLIQLSQSVDFETMVDRVKNNLGLGFVQGCKSHDRPIKTIGVCAGSGSSVLGGVDADLVVTGELSHHEVLAFKAAGVSVIVTNHSNSERKYLSDVLQHRLREQLPPSFTVVVSEADADPLSTF